MKTIKFVSIVKNIKLALLIYKIMNVFLNAMKTIRKKKKKKYV